MFKIVKINKKPAIVNGDGQVIYTPPNFVSFKNYDLTKLLEAFNKKGYRDIEDVMAYEAGKLR